MFPPIWTGSSHYAADLAKKLHESGHHLMVITVKVRNYHSEEDKIYPFKIIRLSNIHLSFKTLFAFFSITSLNLLNYFRFYKIIKNNSIQVIHQVSHYLDTAIITRIVSRITKTPYVVSVHTQLDFEEKIYKPILTLSDRIICGNFILKGAKKIISLDQEILRYLMLTHKKDWILEKNTIIPHGIEINCNDSFYKKSYESSNLIVSVGHVINIRNRYNLIKAIQIICKEFPDIKLEIIGRVYHEKTRELIEELDLGKHIILRGELSHNDTIKRLRQADIHATWINKNYVGMGTAVSETMLLGIPVVNNSQENLLGERKLKDMENIVLINDKNIEEIATKIILLLKNRSLREHIGKHGRTFIINNMNLDIIKDELIHVYESIIKSEAG